MNDASNPAARLSQHELLQERSFWRSLNAADWLFALSIVAIAVAVQLILPHHMDVYEVAILWGSAAMAIGLGWFFKPLRWFIPLSVALAYLSTLIYAGSYDNNSKFLLKYFLSSQSAIMWQCAFVFFALFCYIAGAVVAAKKQQITNTLLGMGTAFAWVSALAGFTGLLVRWHESYLLRPDAGHMPVSNLYEVFILFMVITAVMYLYYGREKSRFILQV